MIITKYVSLGSIVGSILLIVLSLILRNNNIPYLVYVFVISLLAIYRHKTNIVRLMHGEENKLSFSKNKE